MRKIFAHLKKKTLNTAIWRRFMSNLLFSPLLHAEQLNNVEKRREDPDLLLPPKQMIELRYHQQLIFLISVLLVKKMSILNINGLCSNSGSSPDRFRNF